MLFGTSTHTHSLLLLSFIAGFNEYNIKDKSLDARRKPNLYFIYTIDIKVDNEDKILSTIKDNDVLHVEKEEYKFVTKGNLKLNKRPVIIGAGPAGLTAGYEFLKQSKDYEVVILEECKQVGGISKTINLKPQHTMQDVDLIIRECQKQGIKGITVFPAQ